MPPKIDMTGQIFGRLTVVRWSSGRKWECQCICGNTKLVDRCSLMTGGTASCGCLQRELLGKKTELKLAGRRFGRLTVLHSIGIDNNGKLRWLCKCDCGRETSVTSNHISNGSIQSCGCKRLTDYEGHRFRSLWELYWYLAAQVRGHSVEFEPERLPVVVNGKSLIYIPDFRYVGTDTFVEVKGNYSERNHRYGLLKYHAAIERGYRIDLFLRSDIEKWCGMSISSLYRYYSTGGPDAVKTRIALELQTNAA